MRKVVILLLAGLLVRSLVSCNAETGDSPQDGQDPQSENADGSKVSEPSSSGDNAEDSSQQRVSEDALIFSQDGLEVYFTGFEAPPEGLRGYYIKLRIENQSDRDYKVQVEDLSVDGVTVPFGSSIFSAEVLSGKSLSDKI